MTSTSSNTRPRAIDFHAHIIVPEVYAVAAEHNIFSELPADPGTDGGTDGGNGIEERIVSTLEIYEAVDRSLVQSVDREALGRVRTLNPAVPLGVLWSTGPLSAALPVVGAPAGGTIDALCPAVEVLRKADVEKIRAAGLACYVWTVNEPALADRLVAWRVDGILTDRPGIVRARVDRL